MTEAPWAKQASTLWFDDDGVLRRVQHWNAPVPSDVWWMASMTMPGKCTVCTGSTRAGMVVGCLYGAGGTVVMCRRCFTRFGRLGPGVNAALETLLLLTK